MDCNAVCAEDDQKENVSSENLSPSPNGHTPVLSFSELTASQFGISVQSFAPSASPKDKSRLAQLKARRKSSIGVRGSPETNSLIRFMAQRRIKSTSSCQSPELAGFRSDQLQVASLLKQKMASFQNLMDVEESQVCDLMPRRDSSAGGCIRTEDDLSDRDGYNQEREKENYPSKMTPTSSKRRRLEPSESCHFEMTDTKVPVLPWSLEDQEELGKAATQVITQAPSCEDIETVQAELTPASLPLQDLWPSYLYPDNKGGCVFEHSVQPSPGTSAAAPPLQPTSFINIPPASAQLDIGPSVKKKKNVRFGNPLSPEVFDKTMPPSTPLRKGGTPARTPTPGRGLKLRSVLKTPQTSDSDTPKSGPDPSSPFMFGASPTLVTFGPHGRKPAAAAADSLEDTKLFFPSTDEFDSEAPDAEYELDAQPLNLNAAFYEESLSQAQTEFEDHPSTICLLDELRPEPETQPQAIVGAPRRHRSKRKKGPEPECDSASDAPAESSSRKTEQVEPVKRSSRSAAKRACGKMKASAATRKWNKEVDRSLYSSRAYASKNPTLSPIKERRSFTLQPPAAESESASRTDTNLNIEPVAEKTSEDSEFFRSSPEITMGTDKKEPGLKMEKSSVVVDVLVDVATAGETMDEQGEEQAAANPEASWELPCTHTVAEPRVVDPTPDQTAVATGNSDSDTTSEVAATLRAASLPQAPSAEVSNNEKRRKVRRGRRSSSNAPQSHTGCEAVEKDQKGQQLILPDEGGNAGVDLAPWQSHFNLEDVFRPVATRGQHSVRRSLRNQSGTEHNSAGLAWLPHTSPDSIREVRRRTRGRRRSEAPPSLSEET